MEHETQLDRTGSASDIVRSLLDGSISLGDAHPGPGAIVTITLRG